MPDRGVFVTSPRDAVSEPRSQLRDCLRGSSLLVLGYVAFNNRRCLRVFEWEIPTVAGPEVHKRIEFFKGYSLQLPMPPSALGAATSCSGTRGCRRFDFGKLRGLPEAYRASEHAYLNIYQVDRPLTSAISEAVNSGMRPEARTFTRFAGIHNLQTFGKQTR